eukprot:3813374-Amphidinium_carterae.1
MELCVCDLARFRSAGGPGAELSVANQVLLMEEASAGCAWIVNKGIVHRDLKMQNILIAKAAVVGGEKYVPKIADFGLAVPRASSAAREKAGTRGYVAPEAHSSGK